MNLRGLTGLTFLACAGVVACSSSAEDLTSEQTERSQNPVVFGHDDRQQQTSTNAPYDSVGRLDFPGYQCTGTLIGPHTVLTASHCLHGGNAFQAPGNATFRMNLVGGTAKATAFGVRAYRGSPGDFGFIELDRDLSPNGGAWPISNQAPTVGMTVNTIGYDSGVSTPLQVTGCHVKQVAVDIWDGFDADCDNKQGASGGPLFTLTNNTATILGVMSTSCDSTQCTNQETGEYDTTSWRNTWSPVNQITAYPRRAAGIGVGFTGSRWLQVYVSDTETNVVKSRWQKTVSPDVNEPSASYISYIDFQNLSSPSARDLATVEKAAGTAMLFVTSSNGHLYKIQKTSSSPNASWSSWEDCSPSGFASKVTVVRHPAGTLDLFALLSDGSIVGKIGWTDGDLEPVV